MRERAFSPTRTASRAIASTTVGSRGPTGRTREIGTRLALGALENDTLTKFLIEAVTLRGAGGVPGVGFGLLGSFRLLPRQKSSAVESYPGDVF